MGEENLKQQERIKRSPLRCYCVFQVIIFEN